MKKFLILAVMLLSLGIYTSASAAEKSINSNPNSLTNSTLWYAKPLRANFKTFIRACSAEVPAGKVSLYSGDITLFKVLKKINTKDNLLTMSINGTVEIGPLSVPFAVPTDKKSKKRRYLLYVEAFLFGPDGKVYDTQSTTIKGAGSLSPKGGKVGFSVDIGKGYNFSKGGRILLVAGGESILSDYPMDTCVLLGGKWIYLK